MFSQDIEFDIEITKIPAKSAGKEFVVGQFYGSDFRVVHKELLLSDSTQSFHIQLNGVNKTGLFHLFIGDVNEKIINKAEIILSPNERARISSVYFQLKDGSVAVDNSIENQAYVDLLSLREYYGPQIDELYQKRMSISIFSPNYKGLTTEIELETEILQSRFNQDLIELVKLYPSTYTTDVLVPLALIPVRSSNPEWARTYDSYLSFLSKYFFAFCKFEEEAILRHYSFTEKIKQYFNQYSEASSDGARMAIDVIMTSCSENDVVRTFVYNYLLGIFVQLESESLTKYLVDNYSGACSLNLSFEDLKKLQSIQALSIGGSAPEISLPDLNSKYQSLRAFCGKNDYTILFFWLSWCSRCEKEMPVLNEIYQKYKSLDLGVFTVSLDEEKVKWQEKLLTMNKNWVNVAELVPIPNSSVIKNYNISTTPIIYVLDSSGKVLTKGLYGSDLDKFLSELR